VLTSKDADQIARKLGAERKEGKKHEQAVIRSETGRLLGRFGIRRGSKELSHDHIARQINVTMREARDLASCPMSREDYFREMRQRGHM